MMILFCCLFKILIYTKTLTINYTRVHHILIQCLHNFDNQKEIAYDAIKPVQEKPHSMTNFFELVLIRKLVSRYCIYLQLHFSSS